MKIEVMKEPTRCLVCSEMSPPGATGMVPNEAQPDAMVFMHITCAEKVAYAAWAYDCGQREEAERRERMKANDQRRKRLEAVEAGLIPPTGASLR